MHHGIIFPEDRSLSNRICSFLLSHEAASFSLKCFSVRVESEHDVFLLCGQSLLFWIFF